MEPIRISLLAVLVACCGVVAPGSPAAAAAQPAAVAPCAAGVPVASDFDGDTRPELVVGADRRAGFDLYYREQYLQPGDGGTPVWLLDTGELRSADLNGDVCADALLFAGGHNPWLKVVLGTADGLDAAGATEVTIPQAAEIEADPDEDEVLLFEAAGLRHDGFSQIVISGRHMWENDEHHAFVDVLTLDAAITVAGTQVIDFPGMFDWTYSFGVLATSGATVAIGVPNAEVSGHRGAGAVWLYTPDTADPTQLVRRKVLSQNSPGVPGAAENYDGFGLTLAMRDGRLAIGAPGEDDGAIFSSGLVQPIRWHEATRTYTAYRAITQDTSGVPGRNQSRDAFGRSLAIARGLTASGSYDILIGAEEGHGTLKYAGSVTVANFTRAIYRGYTQSTKGIPGSAEADDYFCKVGVLQTSPTVDTVLIGAPGEDTGGVQAVGRALRSDGRKLGSTTTWTSIPIPADAPAGMSRWGLDFGAANG